MTSAEFHQYGSIVEHIGWMACHFSPYGTGISNLPPKLPEGSLLIFNDQLPPCGHDPGQVAQELAQVALKQKCAGLLLDLQHPGMEETAKTVGEICRAAPCPVAVTEHYCTECNCAVFLSPPLHIPLDSFLSHWQGREIWLEAAVEDVEFLITEAGCRKTPLPCPPETFPHTATDCFSRYHIAVGEDSVRFSFHRGKEDVTQMAQMGKNVRCMVGLFQQLR